MRMAVRVHAPGAAALRHRAPNRSACSWVISALRRSMHFLSSQFGGNDLRDALTSNPPMAPAILQGAITGVATTIQMLHGAGARRFLVANAPNIQHAPAVQLGGPAAVAGAGYLVSLYNIGLEGVAALDGYRVSTFAGWTWGASSMRWLPDPGRFGLTNAATPARVFRGSDAKYGDAEATCSGMAAPDRCRPLAAGGGRCPLGLRPGGQSLERSWSSAGTPLIRGTKRPSLGRPFSCLERAKGFELSTPTLARLRSTN